MNATSNSGVIATPLVKFCPKCGQRKEAHKFGKNRNRTDGLGGWCKDCMSEWYYRHRSERIARALNWVRHNVGARQQILKRYSDHHRNECKARSAVGYAVEQGILPPASAQLCIACGDQAQEYHHHNGYRPDHWLDVVPVCTTCHGQADRLYCIRGLGS